jgi:precorrin-3B C17-methyltransferase
MAIEADFAMAFYNPRSASRPEGFEKALAILREGCGAARPISFVRNASLSDQQTRTVTLAEAEPGMADMRTIVILGNSSVRQVGQWVYSPRSVE